MHINRKNLKEPNRRKWDKHSDYGKDNENFFEIASFYFFHTRSLRPLRWSISLKEF